MGLKTAAQLGGATFGGGLGGMALGGLAGGTAIGAFGGPIGAAGGLTYALWKKSQVHPYADPFTRDVQTPFGERTKAFLDPITQAREAGTLTFDQVTAAQEKLESEASDFYAKADAYEVQGSKQKTITTQARSTIDPYVEGWRNTLKADAERLGPKLTAAEIPTLDTIFGGGETAQKRAAKMAGAARKKFAGTSAILTGYKKPPVSLERRTLVGY